MKRAIRKISILILIVALAQSAPVIIAAVTPDIFKELGRQVRDDISNERRNGAEKSCEMLLTNHTKKNE